MLILESISSFFVISGLVISIFIMIDVYRHPQSMKIMNVVWILTGLWGSYLVLWAYFSLGKQNTKTSEMNMEMDDESVNMASNQISMENKPHWQSMTLSALHCGAGCTLADIIGENSRNYITLNIVNNSFINSWILDFILALIIGVFFQYYAIKEMQKISFYSGISKAFKADFFSLLSWQIGMYLWMSLVYFVFFKNIALPKDSSIFWFMMQIAMLVGFLFAYPTNILLIKLRIKKAM